ncbi:Rne/Rng family ribonuclease [Paenibacillus sp. J5C_2022]|uniref:Rne/Rng family ribonuclease n=1 Tax=Paenibacillus sp. J5C2022 TaxID=2977129 RepID=UPI0021D0EE17|nr:Rne/Rng family ribonuclease [Paenibacillus sp. J5C2022]MCU6711099.1 Rne/Rng family ribonuclease [Paenibacillus sp. J5C2022]
MKQMLVQVDGDRIQTAVLQDGKLIDFHLETSHSASLVGNIYRGKVVNVLPGMEAAFIDIGLAKNAFLYINDLLHPNLDKQPGHKPSIADTVRPGEELMVQVVKDPIRGKGARVTTHFNLAGRWLAYMPSADYVAVSKKIDDDAERERLKEIGESLRTGEEGIVMRTAASGAEQEALSGDAKRLRKLWLAILAANETAAAPALLHAEDGLLQRGVRDYFTMDLDEIWADRSDKLEEIAAMLGTIAPSRRERLRLYRTRGGLLQHYGVWQQLEEAFARRIPLDSGGYLIWEETEALTVIDVNTGGYTGTASLEDTVFRTNTEAATLILRLLRIRDTGGIVIVDFIDMERESNRQSIFQSMVQEARKDAAKCTVVGWTRLGLMELTRKKARSSSVRELIGAPRRPL